MPNNERPLKSVYFAVLMAVFSIVLFFIMILDISYLETTSDNDMTYIKARPDIVYYPNEDNLDLVSINDEKFDIVASDNNVKTEEEIIDDYVYMISEWYTNINPELVKSIIYEESRYKPEVSNGSHVGLMQVSTVWHSKRAERLGVTNLYDPYGNILVGIDYLSELLDSIDNNIPLSLMIYNMGNQTANRLYYRGIVSSYATNVLSRV